MDVKFYNIEYLYLMWVLPLIPAAVWYSWKKRKRALSILGASPLVLRMANVPALSRIFLKALLLTAAVFLIILALSRPAWNLKPEKVKAKGRDVIFLIDVSRSMLAADLVPNRLERSKLAVRDCLEYIKGDRVGVVAFAGNSVVKCPLTLDYGFFRMALDDLSPESVSRGGTMLGDAVRKCLKEVFDKRAVKYRDIILITDGEDHESFPVEAAAEAGKEGVRLIVIGIGDEKSGRRIPLIDERGSRYFLKDKSGQEVWSKLNASVLRKMAQNSKDGAYFNVATGMIDLGSVYSDLIEKAEKAEFDEKQVRRYEEKFQVFLLAAFVLLIIEMLISEVGKMANKEK
ncbi:MAG: vWA domain-containing protein [Planctomycetota bacterium]|jgi:Ca-activated chloride channel family protein